MAASVSLAGARNSARLRAATAARVAADATGLLARFRALVAYSSFSTNVDAGKILTFAGVGEVIDARSIEAHVAGGDRAAGSRAFRRRQGTWFVRRVRFEALWRNGRRFVYGAINAGGMGTEGRYGPFCLVVADPSAAAPGEVAVFPGNSAERYCTPAGVVDAVLARSEAASWADRAELAVLAREGDALASREEDWPFVVCRPDRFLEVVVGAALPLSALAEVRMRETYLDRLTELQLAALTGDPLPPSERNEVAAFSAVQDWRSAHGVTITGVR